MKSGWRRKRRRWRCRPRRSPVHVPSAPDFFGERDQLVRVVLGRRVRNGGFLVHTEDLSPDGLPADSAHAGSLAVDAGRRDANRRVRAPARAAARAGAGQFGSTVIWAPARRRWCCAPLRALGHRGPVKSPTYTLVEVYVISSIYWYHFDFYRFNDPAEFEDAGLGEYFRGDSVCPSNGHTRPTATCRMPTSRSSSGSPENRRKTVELSTVRIQRGGRQCLSALAASRPSRPADER